jgi:hypothetical protein
MSRTSVSPRLFRLNLEVLEDRLPLASLSVNPTLMFRLAQPVLTADMSIHQLQTKLATDISTMKTDAGTFTFFSESMATQTKVDQDYAALMSDVAQIHALDVQIHAEVSMAVQVLFFSGAFSPQNPSVRKLAVMEFMALQQLQNDADAIHSAVFMGAPVAASPIASQPLAPQYPAFNTIPGFPG